MKGRSVLLDRLDGRRVAVLLVDGTLEDLLVDPDPAAGPAPGTVFRATVGRAIKFSGGFFVNLPHGSGFLRQAKGLTPGQTVLVQVTGYAEPGKAVPVTLKLLFKSKYAIATPGAPGINVSRRLRDEERRAALLALAHEHASEGTGLIIRSDAERAEDSEIAEDIAEICALAIGFGSQASGAPALLLDGPDSHALAWRDWGHPDELDTQTGCLFERGLQDEIAAAVRPETPLAGGGSMVVEPTRALVAVDVNTGTDTSPAAALKANLAAARALPRALRLRGLGGQVTVDFAPLSKKDRRLVEQALTSALRGDPVETRQIGWTPLGHLELQRKRERPPLAPTFAAGI